MPMIILRSSTPSSTDPDIRVSGKRVSLDDVRIEVADADTSDLAELSRDPTVVDAAPPMPVRLIRPLEPVADSNVEKPTVSWGIEAIGGTESQLSGQGIRVAVLDTGIDKSHVAFEGVQLEEKDFTGEGNGDENGHGTHCAGTLFGRDVEGIRIGVAKGIDQALIGKVLGQQGGGSSDQIAQALHWAVFEKGAHIVSMSLGMDFPGYVKYLVRSGHEEDLATSLALEGYRANVRLFDKLSGLIMAQEALGSGSVVVAAAGNESKRHINPKHRITTAPPAEADGFISVAAIQKCIEKDRLYDIAPFSNSNANLAAPGVGIWSAKAGGGLSCLNGTSMATPHVAGIAALWAEQLRRVTGRIKADEIVKKLCGGAKLNALHPSDVGLGVVQVPE